MQTGLGIILSRNEVTDKAAKLSVTYNGKKKVAELVLNLACI